LIAGYLCCLGCVAIDASLGLGLLYFFVDVESVIRMPQIPLLSSR